MNLKKIIFGFLMSFIAFACTKDEIIKEEENVFGNSEVTDYLLESKTPISGKSSTLNTYPDPDVDYDPAIFLRDWKGKPLCTEIWGGRYFPVTVTYSNFSSTKFINMAIDISNIRSRYANHYNQGDCQLAIIPSSPSPIDCKKGACSEIWYFYKRGGKPEGGGTLNIDVEAPGP